MRSKSKPINSPRVLVPIAFQPITVKQLNLPGYTSSWWVTLGVATLLVSQNNETSREGNGHHLVDDTGQQTHCWQTQQTTRTTCNIHQHTTICLLNNSKYNGSQAILSNRNPNNTCSPHPKKKTLTMKRSQLPTCFTFQAAIGTSPLVVRLIGFTFGLKFDLHLFCLRLWSSRESQQKQ